MANQELVSRRTFLNTTAALAAASAIGARAYAQGTEALRVGLVGCGGRGSGAAQDCINSSDNVSLVALGDLFGDRVNGAKNNLSKKLGDKYKVTEELCFAGWDAYDKVLATDCDMVILATPPGFRPMMFEAAIDAGKHVFMEKPVAVDPAGIRKIIAAAAVADEKKLGVVAGTQRRHQPPYVECLKRIHDGAIGEPVGGQCYWNQGGLWSKKRDDYDTAMEWQIRNWLYFTWLSGDHIVEQHVHNIDVLNWAFGGPPVKAYGMGGRETRTEPVYGCIFDHFAIEYEYANGARVQSMCRQQNGTDSRNEERIVGTKGVAWGNGRIVGDNAWRFDGDKVNPYVQEHTDLIASIRAGEPLNEGQRIAESTMTAIMGRMSAYTGKTVTWDQAMKSGLDLTPARFEFGDIAMPDVAVPGKTPLV